MVDDDVRAVVSAAGLLLPMAIRTAATLRLADLIEAGATGLPELAKRSGADRAGLGRLLRYLVGQGIFEQPAPDAFGLNDRARTLLDDHPAGVRRWLDLERGMGSRMELTYVDMLESVRTGQPVYERRYGRPFWEDVGADPERNRALHASMARTGEGQHRRMRSFIRSYDWNGVREVVDVGGGDGGVLLEILRALPRVKGTLLDLPERLRDIEPRPQDADLWARCTTVGGSFFDPLPSGADIYLLTNVLGDWDDESAIAILRRCGEAAGVRGRIVIPGRAPEERSMPGSDVSDLMLLVTLGGYLRTMADLAELAGAAGLVVRAFTEDYTELASPPA